MPDPRATVGVTIPGERIIELALEIVLEGMRGQTAEQKQKMWDWYITDIERWRRWLRLDDKPEG